MGHKWGEHLQLLRQVLLMQTSPSCAHSQLHSLASLPVDASTSIQQLCSRRCRCRVRCRRHDVAVTDGPGANLASILAAALANLSMVCFSLPIRCVPALRPVAAASEQQCCLLHPPESRSMPASTCAALLHASSFSSSSASFSRMSVLWSKKDTPRGLMRLRALQGTDAHQAVLQRMWSGF